MTTSNEIYKSTVRIECDTPKGSRVGTGFWFSFLDEEKGDLQFLVTNKHVIEDATCIKIRINITSCKDLHEKFYDIVLSQGEEAFVKHPDPNIDISVLPSNDLLLRMKNDGCKPEVFFFTDKDMLLDNFITSIEDIYMTGYPNGLWDSVNNKPVTRKGITASSPKDDWNGKPEFLVDMACFGGSSGSPVYILNQGAFAIENGTAMGKRFIFLGILYAGPTVNANGSIEIVDVPTSTQAFVRTTIGLNLGFVIKAGELNIFKSMAPVKMLDSD